MYKHRLFVTFESFCVCRRETETVCHGVFLNLHLGRQWVERHTIKEALSSWQERFYLGRVIKREEGRGEGRREAVLCRLPFP